MRVATEALARLADEGLDVRQIAAETGMLPASVRSRLRYHGVRAQRCAYGGGLEARFWPRVDRGDGCWLWTGAASHDGYGVIRAFGRQQRAHRVSWQLAHGEIQAEMEVLHRCDVPKCVRPDHLFLGTHADNMADMTAKGRRAVGEHSGTAKLSTAAALEIFRRESAGESPTTLATEFGVSPGAVYFIAQKRSWRHVTEVLT